MDDQREPIGAGDTRETPVPAGTPGGRAPSWVIFARRCAGRSWRFQAAASLIDLGDS